MKKYVPVIAACGAILFGFQNCSEQPAEISPTSSLPSTKLEDPILSRPKPLSQASSLDILTASGDQKITLDLKTGELRQISNRGMVKKCLSEAMKGKILDLLNNSNLCLFEKPGPEIACAQVYTPAYSEIHWPDKSVQVGEAISSCHKNVDLCGQDGKVLRSLLRDVITRWSEWSCEVVQK